jgi:hypothetical protein
MTNDLPHTKEKTGAKFLSLTVKIPDFWLRGRRNPQKALIRKMQTDISNTVDTMYTVLGRTCSCGLPLREGIPTQLQGLPVSRSCCMPRHAAFPFSSLQIKFL